MDVIPRDPDAPDPRPLSGGAEGGMSFTAEEAPHCPEPDCGELVSVLRNSGTGYQWTASPCGHVIGTGDWQITNDPAQTRPWHFRPVPEGLEP